MSGQNTLLKWNKELGIDTLYEEMPIDRTKEVLIVAKTNTPKKAVSNAQVVKTSSESRKLANKANSLQELEQIVRNFEGCQLKKTANNTVFADGKDSAPIMMVGEAPGANEDKEGIPFCGQSGKLLNNILPPIGYEREDVYITNTVFWRPPGNRRPTPEEIEMCRPFVEKHVALLNPKLIILVGSTAVESLLGSKIPMHVLREKYYDYTNPYLKDSIKTAVIFHPSYLLRQPFKKKLMWFDMLRIKKYLDSVS